MAYRPLLLVLPDLDESLQTVRLERVLSSEQNDQIHKTIMDELEVIASQEDVWLDWDSRTSSKYVRGIVDKGYNAPSCSNVLIPQGYCIGKCWRYYDGA